MIKPARKFKTLFYALLALAIAGGLFWNLAPRPEADTTVTFNPATLGDNLDAYLAKSEAQFPDIRPNNQKQIVWAYPASRARTPLTIIYVHGFSASPAEIRPLPDMVASELGANLYFTRLAGHGRSNDAMGSASVNDWVNDFAEAMAIGKKLGEKIIVVATSTGASLATWAAGQPEFAPDIAGLVLISPNYGPQASGSFLLTAPYAEKIVGLIVGESRSFEPRNEAQAANWTYQYPARALIPMAVLVKMANQTDVSDISIPALFVYSPNDAVVRPELTEKIIARWGGPKQTRVVEVTGDNSNHVIAGDILSPGTTRGLADEVTTFIKGL